MWRVGFLSSRPGIGSYEEAFRQSLRELGYIEGQNLATEWRFTQGNVDLLPVLATELVRLKVDCIVTNGTNATRAAKQATSTIPIVMANTEDNPIRSGLVASLARPGGNVTGFISIGSELAGKRLELLKQALPSASRVAILWDANSAPAAEYERETEVAARALRVQFQSLEVRSPDGLEDAFQAAVKGRAQALILVTTGFMNSHQARILNLTFKNRLPVMYSNSLFVLAGGLMSYAADIVDQYRRVATYVDRIWKGAKPADLPVVLPTKFELIINQKSARQIGLTIPRSLLEQADKVIQ